MGDRGLAAKFCPSVDNFKTHDYVLITEYPLCTIVCGFLFLTLLCKAISKQYGITLITAYREANLENSHGIHKTMKQFNWGK